MRTKTIKNSLNPEFPDQVFMKYKFQQRQSVKFEVYDGDSATLDLDTQKLLGSFHCLLSLIVGSNIAIKGQIDTSEKPASIVIFGIEVEEENLDVFEFQASAKALDRKNYLGFGKSDPFYVISRHSNSFVKVFQSEKVVSNLNPAWEPQRIRVQHLCGGNDYSVSLRIQVYDWKSHGKHYFIGEVFTTLEELLEMKDLVLMNQKKAGIFTLNYARVKKQYSFLNYIRGGLDINLIVGIDFGKGTGEQESHHRTVVDSQGIQAFNEYQKTM